MKWNGMEWRQVTVSKQQANVEFVVSYYGTIPRSAHRAKATVVLFMLFVFSQGFFVSGKKSAIIVCKCEITKWPRLCNIIKFPT